MPLYEFHCATCNQSFEIQRKMSDSLSSVECPTCHGGNVQRIFTPIAAFSGSGGQRVAVGGSSGCAGCATSSCAGCASARRN
ncbi:MAG: zinc ribbon domain-containing protein [Chloroflexi bacterium]|nr:zinc ribbon domain-containing protein [Chloroflexota bacterium]